MKPALEIEIKVGVFVALGIGLIMVAILMLGGNDSFWIKKHRYSTHFKTVDGIVVGAKVALGGLPVGVVSDVTFEGGDGNIRVDFQIPSKYATWVRKDTEVEILTQGVLGDKYLSLNPGAPEADVLPDKSEIVARPTKDLSQMLSKSDKLIVSLNSIAGSLDSILKGFDSETRNGMLFRNLSSTAKNLSLATERLNEQIQEVQLGKATKSLASILEKVNNGTGTLGALINDPGLYDDAKALMGGANRNRIIRNLVRKTVKDGDEVETKSDAPQP